VSAPPLGTSIKGPGAPAWRLAYALRATIAQLFVLAYRIRTLGRENLPTDTGYIVAGNHVSYLDPVLMWCVAPQPTHFIARQDLFDIGFLGWLLPRVWSFPIARASADRVAIGRATELLKLGDVVGIFPEGTRQTPEQVAAGETSEAHAGVAFIAMRAGVPVVPVGIAGTEKALPRGAKFPRFPRVTIRYGEPVRPEQFEHLGRKERLSAMTAEIMRRVAQQRALAQEE
jgi:1-acyl-sn-glycerol-3-phosphate acyltransferase